MIPKTKRKYPIILMEHLFQLEERLISDYDSAKLVMRAIEELRFANAIYPRTRIEQTERDNCIFSAIVDLETVKRKRPEFKEDIEKETDYLRHLLIREHKERRLR